MIAVVRQHEAGILERLGRYRRRLEPGLTMTLPWLRIERVDVTRIDRAEDVRG